MKRLKDRAFPNLPDLHPSTSSSGLLTYLPFTGCLIFCYLKWLLSVYILYFQADQKFLNDLKVVFTFSPHAFCFHFVSQKTTPRVWLLMADEFSKELILFSIYRFQLSENGRENKCCAYFHNGRIRPTSCENKHYFICERRAGMARMDKLLWQRKTHRMSRPGLDCTIKDLDEGIASRKLLIFPLFPLESCLPYLSLSFLYVPLIQRGIFFFFTI